MESYSRACQLEKVKSTVGSQGQSSLISEFQKSYRDMQKKV